ncbi:AAA family ATPase [Vogesella amnigena]|uniref:AAA family ATPase n=1 Tax=Vogesella amnigena TaxID=1507449 RepID=UPI0036F40E10
MAELFDPYGHNCLTQNLGPILSRKAAAVALGFLPPAPKNIESVPRHTRRHLLMSLRDLYIPSLDGLRIQETIDLCVRQGYRYRDPNAPLSWQLISGESIQHKTPRAPPQAAVVIGHSGTGKTEAILRAFHCYPRQVITHERFPNIAGPHHQMVWLTADVPANGKAVELAANLMISWDQAMRQWLPERLPRFEGRYGGSAKDGLPMLNEWRQVALTHFLGVLHLDEVQNFFSLESKKTRQQKARIGEQRELKIIEDQCLKWLLSLINTWQIPLILSGTPDGINALTKRLSNAQRFATSGFHHLKHFETPSEPEYRELFLKTLFQYQYVQTPLPLSDDVAELIHKHTAGVPRLIIALWIATHRVAFENTRRDALTTDDIERAASTYLAPVKDAVEALRSNDPLRMARYEDLLPTDDFWREFFSS